MKIAMYAIALNEERHIQRCMESCKDADYFILADTGSTDRTVEIANSLGAITYNININPWRFDLARNTALSLVPSDVDICISIDIDEVMEPGWREEIEKAWSKDINRIRYILDTGNGGKFINDKIHSRSGYYWKYLCHEAVCPDFRTQENFALIDKILIRHLPDLEKSREKYLDMLEIGVRENPHDPRSSFYYARELVFQGKNPEAITEIIRYLQMPNATWKDERAYMMRMLARLLQKASDWGQAEKWLVQATNEAPHRRESWVDLSQFYYEKQNWDGCLSAAETGISIEIGRYAWLNDQSCWGERPYDLAAIACYSLGLWEKAFQYGYKALELSPDDGRLQDNLSWYKAKLN